MVRPPTPPGEPSDAGDRRVGARRRGTLGQARTYRPRGRTVRELPVREGRSGERAPAEPVRTKGTTGGRPGPALQVLDGGRDTAEGSARPRNATERTAVKSGKGASPRNGGGRAAAPARKGSGDRRGPGRAPKPPRLADPRRRLRLATVLAVTLFTVLGVRLVELQLTDGPAYAASGLESRLQHVVLPAPRGTIYDREGAVLAHSVEARSVFADPEEVEDPEAAAATLAPLLGVPASKLRERMTPQVRADGGRSRFEWLARRVDVAVGDAVVELNLRGIVVTRDERRNVPGHDLAANVIGFTGEEHVGLEGLEAYYDDVLRGVPGRRTYESGLGREIPGGYLVETPADPGNSIRLTLDMDLQYEVQRILVESLREGGAAFGAAVVLDAHTGEALALASEPTYDAADPWSADQDDWVDVATARVVDPGSSHKPLVFGAALQEGVLAPGESLVVGPTIRKGDVTFRDHGRPFPEGTAITLPTAMAFSSNVATIMVADRLGKEKLYEYQRAFGLGSATGIGMPAEASGQLLSPDDWSGSAYGSVPIGHSIAATPLQMAAAYAAIANGGVWVQPRLVQAVIAPDGTETATDPPRTRHVLGPANAAAVREMMEAVVAVPGATGENAAVDNYRVAGKTGTGRLVVDGEYVPGEVSSFVGMAPADHPRYVVAVFAHLSGGGNATVNLAFQEMMGFTLKHYRVPPATSEPPAFNLHP